MKANRSLFWCLLLCLPALLLAGCPEDIEGPDWGCDCEPGQVCRDGVCYPADAGGDAGDMGEEGEFIDNPECPASGIFINEFVYDPASGTPEWVEIKGPAGRDLDGFHLVNINGTGGDEEADVVLDGGLGSDGLFLIAASALAGADQLSEDLVMQNGPDNLQLRDCIGQVVDAVGYGNFTSESVFAGEGTAAPATGKGPSLARCPGAADTNDNSADFHVSDEPTPAAENDNFEDPYACEPCVGGTFDGKVVINEILYDPEDADTVANEFLELRGTPGLDLSGLTVKCINGSNGDAYMTFNLEGQINVDGFFTIGNPSLANFALPATLQQGPDSVQLLDCEGSIVDALAYDTFDVDEFPAGEGTSAAGARESYSLARCDGTTLADIDSNDNAVDFHEATPSPYVANTGFTDLRACGGTVCEPGLLTGRVHLNEFLYGSAGFVEVRGEANLGLADTSIVVLDGAGTEVGVLELSGSLDSNGYASVDATAIPQAGGTLKLRDCLDVVIDAVAWGTGTSLQGEGTEAPAPGTDQALGRCPSGVDTDNNFNDFKLITTPTRGAENANFVDPEECGIPVCVPGSLAGHVVINEMLYDPAGTDSDLATFIELRGDPGINLTDAQLIKYQASGTQSGTPLVLSGVIPSSGYYVVGQNLSITPNLTTNFADLTNSGGFLRLRDCSESVVDTVGYGSVTGTGLAEGAPATGTATNSGQSLVRCAGETLAAIDHDSNADDFDTSSTPTPGALNLGFSGRVCPLGPCTNDLTGLAVINEFLANEPGSEGSVHWSFVEIRGVPGTSLLGAQLLFIGDRLVGTAPDIDQEHTLTGVIPEGTGGDTAGLYVIGESSVPNLDQSAPSMNIQNGPDNIWLMDSCGHLIDAVGYGTFVGTGAYFGGEGSAIPVSPYDEYGSLGRKPTENLADCDTGNNSYDFCVIPMGTSPNYAHNAGLVNPTCP